MVLPAPFSPTIATLVPGGQHQVDRLQHGGVGAGVGERDAVEPDAVAQRVGRRHLRAVHGLRLHQRPHPRQVGHAPGRPLELLEDRDRGGDLLVHLRRERDDEHHVADRPLPGDRVPQHQERRRDVRDRERQLTGRAQGVGAHLARPQDRGRGVPRPPQPRADLALQPARAQLLGGRRRRATGRTGAARGGCRRRRRRAPRPGRSPRGGPRTSGGSAASGRSSSHGLSSASRTPVMTSATPSPTADSSACIDPQPDRFELGAQHLQPVRVLGALVVLDARRVVREPDEVALQAHDRLVAQLEVEDVREVARGQRGDDQHRDEDGRDRRPPGVPGDRRVGQRGERGRGQRQRHRLQHHQHRGQRELAGADPPRQPEQRPAPGHGLPHDSTSFPSASSPAANRSACSRNSRA